MTSAQEGQRGGGGLTAWLVGLAAATRHARLVVVVWGLLLVLSVIAAWPAWRWLTEVLPPAPSADAFLEDFDLPLMKELAAGDGLPAFGLAAWGLPFVVVAGLLVNPFLAGGILHSLAPDRVRIVFGRLVEGGLRYFWRCFFAVLPVGLLGILSVVTLTGLGGAATRAIADRGFEGLALVAGAITALLTAVAIGLCFLLLDVTRVRLVRQEGQSVWQAFGGAVWLFMKRPLAFVALGLAGAVSTALVVAAGAGLIAILPQATWPMIALGIIAHQLVALMRTWLRVGLLAGVATLVEWSEPASSAPGAVAAMADVTFPDQPVVREYEETVER